VTNPDAVARSSGRERNASPLQLLQEIKINHAALSKVTTVTTTITTNANVNVVAHNHYR
jgi:hypothetical protein